MNHSHCVVRTTKPYSHSVPFLRKEEGRGLPMLVSSAASSLVDKKAQLLDMMVDEFGELWYELTGKKILAFPILKGTPERKTGAVANHIACVTHSWDAETTHRYLSACHPDVLLGNTPISFDMADYTAARKRREEQQEHE